MSKGWVKRLASVIGIAVVVVGGAFWLFIAFLNDIFDAIF